MAMMLEDWFKLGQHLLHRTNVLKRTLPGVLEEKSVRAMHVVTDGCIRGPPQRGDLGARSVFNEVGRL